MNADLGLLIGFELSVAASCVHLWAVSPLHLKGSLERPVVQRLVILDMGKGH